MELEALNELKYLNKEQEALEEEREMLLSLSEDSAFDHAIVEIDGNIEENRKRKEAIEKALSGIDDNEVLQMIELYLQGKTWEQINMRIYHYHSRQACRLRVKRVLQNIDISGDTGE